MGFDAAVVDRFVEDFLALLDVRLQRIAACLRVRDCEEIIVAVLSLETTAAMIRAHELAAPAKSLRSAVAAADFAAAEQQNAEIIDAAERLRIDLRAAAAP